MANVNPIIQQIYGTSAQDIKKINDNFQNLSMNNQELTSSTTVITTPTRVVSTIDYYNNGFIVTYTDGTIFDWSYVKDGLGRITSLTNNTKGSTITVHWKGVNK